MSRSSADAKQMASVFVNGKPAQVDTYGVATNGTLIKLCSPADADRFAGYLSKPGACLAVVLQTTNRHFPNEDAFRTGQTEQVKAGKRTVRQVYVDYAALDMRLGIFIPS